MFYLVLCLIGSSSCYHTSYVHSLYSSPCHASLGVPKGVTVLEYELPEPEGQQGELPQGVEEEDLPESLTIVPLLTLKASPGAL